MNKLHNQFKFCRAILLANKPSARISSPRLVKYQPTASFVTSKSVFKPDSNTTSSTVDEKEIQKFKQLATAWWTENGEFEALHRMNQLRVPMIRDAMKSYIVSTPQRPSETTPSVDEPLSGLNILDIGCGGGILSEALARLGAQVTGIDACKENIQTAQVRVHSEYERTGQSYCKRLSYLNCTVEELASVEDNAGYFDAVVMSEVVEHVNNVGGFVESSVNLLKNQGYLFITTINKTQESYLLAILGAEYLLNLVPRGTHEWAKFVRPEDLKQMLKENEVTVRYEMGMLYNPLTKSWSWTRHQGVNYALYGQKLSTSLWIFFLYLSTKQYLSQILKINDYLVAVEFIYIISAHISFLGAFQVNICKWIDLERFCNKIKIEILYRVVEDLVITIILQFQSDYVDDKQSTC